MKFTLKLHKNHYPKTYFNFMLIEIDFINSIQVIALNITLCNIYFQILKEKKT